MNTYLCMYIAYFYQCTMCCIINKYEYDSTKLEAPWKGVIRSWSCTEGAMASKVIQTAWLHRHEKKVMLRFFVWYSTCISHNMWYSATVDHFRVAKLDISTAVDTVEQITSISLLPIRTFSHAVLFCTNFTKYAKMGNKKISQESCRAVTTASRGRIYRSCALRIGTNGPRMAKICIFVWTVVLWQSCGKQTFGHCTCLICPAEKTSS